MDFAQYLEEIERLRPAAGVPENLVVLPTVDSTNRLGRRIATVYEEESETIHPLLIVSLEQTGGRGRLGRTWESPAGKGVYATRVVTVEDASRLQGLPLLVGVGLCRALAPYLPSSCRLKWPNDLMVGSERRKIGGILIEAAARTGGPSLAVVGFGVNLSHEAADLPETGTSVRLLGGDVSLEELTWALVQGVERELAHLGDMPYAAAAWRGLSAWQPGEPLAFRTADGLVEGTFEGIDDDGRLVLRSGGGELRLSSGEVIGSSGREP
jgi:BirA family biotin operon repressor/biotin-[acetyl-CoA-carboxylase] ligase